MTYPGDDNVVRSLRSRYSQTWICVVWRQSKAPAFRLGARSFGSTFLDQGRITCLTTPTAFRRSDSRKKHQAYSSTRAIFSETITQDPLNIGGWATTINSWNLLHIIVITSPRLRHRYSIHNIRGRMAPARFIVRGSTSP